MFILQIALDEIASVQSRSIFEPSLYYEDEPAPICKKHKPTIIICIEVKVVDGVKKDLCSLNCQVSRHDKVLSVGLGVGDYSQLHVASELFDSHAYMFALSPCVVLEAVFPYCHLNTSLLLHFIITVAILAVTVRTFIPFVRVKSNCKGTTVYTQM